MISLQSQTDGKALTLHWNGLVAFINSVTAEVISFECSLNIMIYS